MVEVTHSVISIDDEVKDSAFNDEAASVRVQVHTQYETTSTPHNL